MATVSRMVTIGGIVLILLPIVGGIATVFGSDFLSLATDRAPTFMLLGIFLFVVGVGLREYSSW